MEKEYCCLCERCGYPPRAQIFIDKFGQSCHKLDSTMFNPHNPSTAGSTTCLNLQNEWRSVCCDPNSSFQSVPQAPVPAPANNFPQGTEQPCDVCFSGAYPTKPHTITSVKWVPGNPTCGDLYWMGRTGNIPSAVCYPMQQFMQEPCGCTRPSPTPGPPGPFPLPSPPSPGVIPPKKKRPPAKKDDLKLSGGRDRGTTNTKRLLALRGEYL